MKLKPPGYSCKGENRALQLMYNLIQSLLVERHTM